MASLENVYGCEGVSSCDVVVGIGEGATDPEFCAASACVRSCSEYVVVCGLSVVACWCTCFL